MQQATQHDVHYLLGPGSRHMNHRASSFKSDSLARSGLAQRRHQGADTAKTSRNVLLRIKRLRRSQPSESAQVCSDGGAPVPPLPDRDAVAAAVMALAAEHDMGSAGHLKAIVALRQILSTGDETAVQLALEAGVIPPLVRALQGGSRPEAAEAILEAAWALTNIAAADHAAAAAALPTAPILIAHLSGPTGGQLARQCAWTIGNLAGDCQEFRDTLVANGALQPLARLVISATASPAATGPHVTNDQEPTIADFDRSSDRPSSDVAATGAWALSNLVRGVGPEVGQLLAVPGFAESLAALLADCHDATLVSEAAWVATYLTAASPGILLRLVQAGVIPPLISRLVATTPSREAVEKADRGILTPVLRTFGNLAAGGGKAVSEQLLSSADGGAAAAVVRCIQSSHGGISKEACWAAANVAGTPGRAGCDAIVAAGGATVALEVLRDGGFQLRKEAAFLIANICAGGGGGSGDAAALAALMGSPSTGLGDMMDLMRSADAEAVQLGFEFTEMVLRVMPGGPQAVEAVDGIDTLESLQFRGPADMQELAFQLVDQYFGDDYGVGE